MCFTGGHIGEPNMQAMRDAFLRFHQIANQNEVKKCTEKVIFCLKDGRSKNAKPFSRRLLERDCKFWSKLLYWINVISDSSEADTKLLYQLFIILGKANYWQPMNAKNLLLDSLDKGRATYRVKLNLCRKEFSKSSIHDLRTSIRRLLALLDIVAFVTSRSSVEKLSDGLKEQLDGFDELRDIQVMLDKVSENIKTLPELEPLEKYLKKREKRKERVAQKYVKNIKLGSISKRLLKIRATVEELSAEELNGKLPQAVDEAFLTVMQLYGEIDTGQPVTIHYLRISFKKFRYMVEAIYPSLPDFPESNLDRMHDYQTQMGDIHDAQVLLETLTDFAADNDSYDPEPVRRFFEKVLAEGLSRFLKNKDEVITFWRPTPLAAFPWEGDETKKEQ